MANNKEFHVLGEPVEVKIGKIHPFKVSDYPNYFKFSPVLAMDKNTLVNYFKELPEKDVATERFIEGLQNITMFEFITMFAAEPTSDKDGFFHELYSMYRELFNESFKDDVFDDIKSAKDFDLYLSIIRDVNGVEYEPTVPNPVIERRKQLKKEMEAMKNENITFESMYTSVCVGLGKLPSEVNEMTIYQLNKIFERIAKFKTHDMTTLFATVSAEAKIEDWYKSTSKKEEAQYITDEELENAKKSKITPLKVKK